MTMSIFSYLRSLLKWVLKGKFLFLFIALFFLPMIFVQYEINETGIKVYGLFLQLFGVIPLILSLKERSVLFGKSTFFKALLTYFREFPLKGKPITLNVSGGLHGHTSLTADLQGKILPKKISKI